MCLHAVHVNSLQVLKHAAIFYSSLNIVYTSLFLYYLNMVIIKLSQTSIRCTEIIKRKCNLTVSNLIKLTHNKILIIKLIKTT